MVRPQRLQKQSAFYRLLFVVCLTIGLLVVPPWVSAKESQQPKPQEWQINGILAALDDGYPGVKQAAFGKFAEYDAKDLAAFPKQSEEMVKKAIGLVNDSKAESYLRIMAAAALRDLGRADVSVVKFLTNLLNDSKAESYLRINAARALGRLGKADANVVKFLINLVDDSKEDSSLRINAAYALGALGKADVSVVKFLTNLLSDSKAESYLRINAAGALGRLGKADASVVKFLTNLINNSKEDSSLRMQAAAELATLSKADANVVKFLTNLVNNSKEDSSLRINAAYALGNLGKADASVVEFLTNLINDSRATSYARVIAADALGNLGKADASVVEFLTNLINDSKADFDSRVKAAYALGNLKRLNLAEVFVLINLIYAADSNHLVEPRFAVYFYSGGDSSIKTLLKWIGRPDSKSIPTQLTHAEARATLEVFRDVWEPSKSFSSIRGDLAKAIADVAKMGAWEPSDIALLTAHSQNLSVIHSNSADSVNKAIESLTVWQWFNSTRNVIAAHIAFWLALIFAYPKSPQVQAIFFWNPWVRRILGVGYVGFLLTWVPFLRRKLFEPFQFSLLADSGVDRFNPAAYFPQSDVKPLDAKEGVAIAIAIPTIKGQIVLEGDSGLGKSMFLRHLVKHSPRTVVFLPARKCEQGVIEAIQTKLHGQAQDAEFLKNLIYSGAIDLCIDGLNEVTADTRAKITQFVESYFKGNIIMTTQPLEWLPPSTAKIYQLQPLRSDQIQDFLLSRSAIVAPDLVDKYTHACCTYLNEVLDNQQSPEELAAIQRTLSNPMDLTVVAQMIALGKQPNLLRLQEQQYNLMAAEYQQQWSQDFPLKKFSEAVYQLRLNDEKALPADEFYQELVSMEDEKYKMVVSRQWKDAKGEAQHEWYFRHDKIMEFFIVQTFLGDSTTAQNRLLDHMSDPRFRGVYFLLATLLPLPDAKDLRERLIQYAADTKDHTVSDTFVQLLRTR